MSIQTTPADEVGKRPLPDGWKLVKLGEVCEVIAGQSPPGASYNSEGNGAEFHQGKVAFGSTHLKWSGKWTTMPRRFAEPGDVVMSIRAPVGPVNVTDRRVAIGRGLASVRPVNEIASPKWMFHYLRCIESDLTGTQGTTFASINKGQIEQIRIPLPPLREQERIVRALEERFESIDAARRAAETQLDAINNLTQSYLAQAFAGEL